MKVFVILLAALVIPITFASIHAESTDFRFIELNDSYDIDDEFLIKFEKITQQPCPSYEVSIMKKGVLESKITYGVEPMCAVPEPVESYLFNAKFEKSEFFDSVGTYIIQVTLDDETIQKEITITNNRNLEYKFKKSFPIYQKQVKYIIPYQITNGTIENMKLNCEPPILTVSISSNDSGSLQMEIPKTMMRSIFSILVNDQEWENVSIDGNTLTVTFPKNSKTIVIKSGYLLTSDKNSDGVCDIIHEPPYSFIIPPQQQFQSGISFNEIQCKDGLVLVQKYNGNPACVTPETVPKLVTRGWGTSDNWVKISNANTAIHYETNSAKITSIEAFSEYKNPSLPGETKQTWLRIVIESDQDGNLKTTLPRDLLDSKIGSADDDFFVLLDGTETEYSETKNESKRMLNFTISPKTELVEIIGYGFYNPDFNELNYGSLAELDKKCSIEKPGSIWYDTEKLCMYTNHTTITGGHTIPSCNNGTIILSDNHAKTIPVLMMQPSSTGTICITYNFPYDWETFPNKDWYPDHKIHFDRFDIDSEYFTITANPEWIDAQTISAGDNVTVTYKIHADSNSQGLYDTVIPYGHCQRYPLAVGYDESEIMPSDFPNAYMTPPCVLVFSGEKQVTIVSGMDYFELDYK